MAQTPVDVLIQIESWLRNIIRDEIKAAMEKKEPSALKSSYEPVAKTNLLSLRELAEYLGLSPAMARRLYIEKRIGHYRIGRRILFSKTDHVEPFLRARATEIEPYQLGPN